MFDTTVFRADIICFRGRIKYQLPDARNYPVSKRFRIYHRRTPMSNLFKSITLYTKPQILQLITSSHTRPTTRRNPHPYCWPTISRLSDISSTPSSITTSTATTWSAIPPSMHTRLVLRRLCRSRSIEGIRTRCAIGRVARGRPGVEAEEGGEVEGEEGKEGVCGVGRGGHFGEGLCVRANEFM